MIKSSLSLLIKIFYSVINLVFLTFLKVKFFYYVFLISEYDILRLYSQYLVFFLIFFTLINFILIHSLKYFFNKKLFYLHIYFSLKKETLSTLKIIFRDIIVGLVFTNFIFANFILIFLFKLVIIENNVFELKIYNWFKFNDISKNVVYNIDCEFLLDNLTMVMFFVVIFISSLIHLYSLNYMGHDKQLLKFISYLSLFTFFMILLVSAGNVLQLFFGWEGVGLCSYLLINFWHTRIQANKAALKAMFMNRIGDWGLLLGIIYLFVYFKTLNFNELKYLLIKNNFDGLCVYIFNFEINLFSFICIFLLIGAIGKSAQFGLHTWLPDAMEGPTPVSALIHAATMVTAGVFLIIRMSFLFEKSPLALSLIIFFGGITIVFGATTAAFQYDIKKIVAFSTCSQLGYMFLSCGISEYNLALFHLFNHAFFKALLFLTSGALIHELKDEQDIRKMGGLIKYFPGLFLFFSIGSLSLMGITGLSGYYSKDLIIEKSYLLNNSVGYFGFICSLIGVLFTSIYSVRLIYFVFFNKNRNKSFVKTYHKHEKSFALYFPLLALSILSILSGYVFKDIFLSLDLNNTLINIVDNSNYLPFLSISLIVNFLIVLSLIINYFIVMNSLINHKLLKLYNLLKFISTKKNNKNNMKVITNFYYFFNKKYFIDIYYNKFSENLLIKSYYGIFTFYDRYFLETFGPLGISNVYRLFSTNLKKLQSGFISDYSFYVILSICFINFYFYMCII